MSQRAEWPKVFDIPKCGVFEVLDVPKLNVLKLSVRKVSVHNNIYGIIWELFPNGGPPFGNPYQPHGSV